MEPLTPGSSWTSSEDRELQSRSGSLERHHCRDLTSGTARTSYLVNVPMVCNFFSADGMEQAFNKIQEFIEKNPFLISSDSSSSYDIHLVIGLNQRELDVESEKLREALGENYESLLDLLRDKRISTPEDIEGLVQRLGDLEAQTTELETQIASNKDRLRALSNPDPRTDRDAREINNLIKRLSQQVKDINKEIKGIQSESSTAKAGILVSIEELYNAQFAADFRRRLSCIGTHVQVHPQYYMWKKKGEDVNYAGIRNRLLGLPINREIVDEVARGGVDRERNVIYLTLDPDTILDPRQLERVEGELCGPSKSILVAGHYELATLQSEASRPALIVDGDRLDWPNFIIGMHTRRDIELKEYLASENVQLVLCEYQEVSFSEFSDLDASQKASLLANNLKALEEKLKEVRRLPSVSTDASDGVQARLLELIEFYNTPDDWTESHVARMQGFVEGLKVGIPTEKFKGIHPLSTVSKEISLAQVLYPPEPVLAFLLYQRTSPTSSTVEGSLASGEVERAVVADAASEEFHLLRNLGGTIQLWGRDGASGEGQELAKNIQKIWETSLSAKKIKPISFPLRYQTQVPGRFLRQISSDSDRPLDRAMFSRLPRTRADLLACLRAESSSTEAATVDEGARDEVALVSFKELREAIGHFHQNIRQSSLNSYFPEQRKPWLKDQFGAEAEAINKKFLAVYRHRLEIILDSAIKDTMKELEKICVLE